MNLFDFFNPSIILDLLAIAGWIIGGVVAVKGVWDKESRERRLENDSVTKDLLENMEKKVNAQNQIIVSLSTTSDEQTKQIHKLQGANETLTAVLNGRDPAQADIFKQAPEIFAIAKENNSLSKANGAAITELTRVMQDFIKELKPLLK